MDFLETDFHKHRLPRRSIIFRNNDNPLTGLNTSKYQSFNKLILELIAQDFNKDILTKIEKGVYKTNLPNNLLDLIRLQISKITDSHVVSITERISSELANSAVLYAKEYDVALANSIDEATILVRDELVRPFMESIEKPLQNLNLGDEDNIYLIEEELAEVILKLLDNKISELLNMLIAQNEVNVQKELESVFAPQDVKES